MPVMNETASTDLMRGLLYGEPKTRKTWWALKAAELGYNVILADFDHGAAIAKHLTPEARARIFHIDMRMPSEQKNKNSAFTTLAVAASGAVTYYDDDLRCKATAKTFEADHSYTKFDLMNATSNDVLIIDSWTALCHQIGEFNDMALDVLRVADFTEQSVYKVLRTHADRLIANLQRLPCHVIFICHAVEYAKRRADAKKTATPDEAVEWIKTVPSSVTKDHGRQMAKDASDALFFELANAMQGVYVSTKPTSDLIVGSRTLPPMRKAWDELGVDLILPQLSEICQNFNSAALSTVKGSEILAGTKSGSATLDATKTPIMKIGTKA